MIENKCHLSGNPQWAQGGKADRKSLHCVCKTLSKDKLELRWTTETEPVSSSLVVTKLRHEQINMNFWGLSQGFMCDLVTTQVSLVG